tara:strand:- start:890 stop:2029 length:1140 start_codon:yes stop_codon:yes gene_type:complete
MRLQLTLVIWLFWSSTSVLAQNSKEQNGFLVRYLERVFGEEEDSTAPKLINYPTLAFAPETSWEIGISSLFVYSANRDLRNRLSEIKSFAFFTLENQYGLWLDHAVYSDGDRWFFYGKARYQSFPLFYYGIGRNSPAEVQSVIEGEYLIFRERIMRETRRSLYFGLEFDYQSLVGVEYSNMVQGFDVPEIGNKGSKNLGLGFGLIYNNIYNAMNPRKGVYSEWGFLAYNSFVGSDFNFTSYISDTRLYKSCSKNKVLAFQVYSQLTRGNPPFNMLALMGGESLMRGYYLGRYRDKNLLAGQLEYRILPFSFSKRLGASVFMAMGQVFGEDHSFGWQHFLPAGGAGLRFLIFPEKDIYTRLDMAFTTEGNGIYFFIGEAF